MWACGIRRLTVKKVLCKNSRVSFIIKDPQQREHWRTGHNRKLVFSLFQCADSVNSYSMSQNKAFRVVVWDRSVPSSETSNFRLLVMTSVTSAFSLLMHTIRRTPSQQSLSFTCSDPELFSMNGVRSLLSPRGMLLGYSFEPRPNHRVLATAWSFMTVGLSLNRCSHSKKPVWRERTRLTLVYKFGLRWLQRFDMIQAESQLHFTQENKRRFLHGAGC